MKQKLTASLIFALLFLFSIMAIPALAIPNGLDNITIIDTQTKAAKGGAPVTADGGNITWLNVSVRAQTTIWQGFVGNITNSGLVLDDTSGDRFYSWTLVNTSGEIYASRNSSVIWTAVSPQNICAIEEALTGTGSDKTSRTYTTSGNTVNFSIGTIVINSSSACSVLPYINSSAQTTTNFFENLLLTTDISSGPNNASNNTIYAGILQASGTAGFDAGYYNFQLMVPVNRSTGFSTYYMYAEIN